MEDGPAAPSPASRRRTRARVSVAHLPVALDTGTEPTTTSASLIRLRTLKERLLQDLKEQERRKGHSGDRVSRLALVGEGAEKEAAAGDAERGWTHPRSIVAGGPDAWGQSSPQLRDFLRTSVGREALRDLDGLQKERLALASENQRLRDIVTLRQECYARGEQRSQRRIRELQQQLDRVILTPATEATPLPRLRAMAEVVQAEVQHLRATIESRAEEEKAALVREYRAKMHDVKKQLAEERALNYTGAQEWIEKSKLLQRDLDAATRELDSLVERNRKLGAENQTLKAAFQEQEKRRQDMVKGIAVVAKENHRLEEHIRKLEEQTLQAVQQTYVNAEAPQPADLGVRRDDTTFTREMQDRYNRMMTRLKTDLERDRRALQQVRSQQMAAQAQRSELEVFLRQCLDDVRREVTHHTQALVSRSSFPQPDVREIDFSIDHYTAHDHRKALDILLSKERVLRLLLARTFPGQRGRKEASASPPAVIAPTVPLDEDPLWLDWKARTGSPEDIVPPALLPPPP